MNATKTVTCTQTYADLLPRKPSSPLANLLLKSNSSICGGPYIQNSLPISYFQVMQE